MRNKTGGRLSNEDGKVYAAGTAIFMTKTKKATDEDSLGMRITYSDLRNDNDSDADDGIGSQESGEEEYESEQDDEEEKLPFVEEYKAGDKVFRVTKRPDPKE